MDYIKYKNNTEILKSIFCCVNNLKCYKLYLDYEECVKQNKNGNNKCNKMLKLYDKCNKI